MQHRILKDLAVSSIGLGCMGMSEFYGASDEAQSLQVLDHAFEQGLNFWDTADIYGCGDNERLLAKALKGRRDKVVLASKFGIVRSDDPNERGLNASPAYVKMAIEQSLKNLKTDYLDLYYLHRMDPNTPIEDTMQALSDLVKAGKIKHIGLSEAPVETIKRAHAVHPLTALQTEYSLVTRDVERNGILDLCRVLNIGFVPYSPLGRGLLTNTLKTLAQDDVRNSLPRFQGENFTKNQQLVSKLAEISEEKGCSTAQLCLAWVLAQGDFIVPIPGTRHVHYLQDNIDATTIKLTAAELSILDQLSSVDAVAGTRYPAEHMKIYGLAE